MNDVIIIGGGPAGSTLASYLAKAEIGVTVFESLNHPRAHVGESLVTSTMPVMEEIGVIDEIRAAGFPVKFGASWHAPGGREAAIRFREFNEDGINFDHTFHVDRSKFDLMLLKHAEKLGAKVYQGVHVKKVLFEGDQASGVTVEIGGQEVDVPAKVVVDASGRGTLLGRQLKSKKMDPIFNQYAVHAWFKELDRGEGSTADYIHIYFLPVERGWVWQIPITDQITSVGIVAERDVFKQSRMDPDTYFNTYINTNPDLTNAMRNAVRINEYKFEGDYSYIMERFVGNGFLMVGDAARFVDPIFSSGVSVAMNSAKFAAERIQHAFLIDDFSEAVFKPYEDKLRGGVAIWYEFIRLYYKLLPLFTHFVQSKEHRYEITRLLQGVVFDRSEVPVLDSMRRYIEAVESNPNHIFSKQLSSIPID
jgi:1H-pyrrole-2-carbonyl-[peptidyl-carrier protein] chlorinase